jgi:hypothetical protein
MSADEVVLPAATRRPWTATEKNWLWGVGIVVALVLLFTLVGRLEDGQRREKLVWNASETSTRFLAIAHTLVATSFLLTSRRMRSARGRAWFGALTVAGIGACFAYAALGGKHAPLAELLFYAYFLLHEIRDEIFFYKVNGDVPAGAEPSERALWATPLLLAGALAFPIAALAAFDVAGPVRLRDAFEGLPQGLRLAIGVAALLAAVALVVVAARGVARLARGGLREALSVHRPIFFVFVGIYALLAVGIAATGRMYAIVGVHVAIWWVFTVRQMSARPPPVPRPRPLTWSWVKSTPAGFNLFHAAVLFVVVAAAAWRAFGFLNAPEPRALALLVSKESFPYWTLLHVTWSWVPRG